MTSERLRPGVIASRQRQALAEFLSGEVAPFSALYGHRLAASDLSRSRRLAKADALSRLPPTDLDEIDHVAAVLHPTRATMGRSRWRWRWLLARITGRRSAFAARVIEPLYRPIHWDRHGSLLVGSSAADLDRLAEIGRRWLEHAGIEQRDVVVDVHPSPLELGFWQLTLGCRAAGVQAIHLGEAVSAAMVASLRPAVLAGPPAVLHRLLESETSFGHLRTMLVTGHAPSDTQVAALRAAAGPDIAVLTGWAPPGVRALWAECREAGALHTWPDAELIEVVDPLSDVSVPDGADGELLWTGIGWRGTALVRLRTGVFGGIRSDRCPGCGRTTPRIDVVGLEPRFSAVLDGRTGIAAWQAELRTVDGTEELLVFLTPAGRAGLVEMLDELDEELGVTQFVVMSRAALTRRMERSGGDRIIDTR